MKYDAILTCHERTLWSKTWIATYIYEEYRHLSLNILLLPHDGQNNLLSQSSCPVTGT